MCQFSLCPLQLSHLAIETCLHFLGPLFRFDPFLVDPCILLYPLDIELILELPHLIDLLIQIILSEVQGCIQPPDVLAHLHTISIVFELDDIHLDLFDKLPVLRDHDQQRVVRESGLKRVQFLLSEGLLI